MFPQALVSCFPASILYCVFHLLIRGRGAGVNDAGFKDWRRNVFYTAVYQVLSTVL